MPVLMRKTIGYYFLHNSLGSLEDMYCSQGHGSTVQRTRQNYAAKFLRNEPGLFL